ncbi:nucleolar protein 56-like [Heptranchias perlo]|uniref:nucleolar protein 56-like n=1 Tax=Heptranchias perlo TaxID=212740 RepID=UPI00355AAE7E
MKEDTNTSMGGIVHEDMRLLLETNMPASSKKKVILGVADPKIGAAVQEEIGIQCQTGGVVAEIIRDEEFGAIELGPQNFTLLLRSQELLH